MQAWNHQVSLIEHESIYSPEARCKLVSNADSRSRRIFDAVQNQRGKSVRFVVELKH